MASFHLHLSDRLDKRVDQAIEDLGFSSKTDFFQIASIHFLQWLELPDRSCPLPPTATTQPQPTNPGVQPAPTYPNYVAAVPSPTVKKKPTTKEDLKKKPKTRSKLTVKK